MSRRWSYEQEMLLLAGLDVSIDYNLNMDYCLPRLFRADSPRTWKEISNFIQEIMLRHVNSKGLKMNFRRHGSEIARLSKEDKEKLPEYRVMAKEVLGLPSPASDVGNRDGSNCASEPFAIVQRKRKAAQNDETPAKAFPSMRDRSSTMEGLSAAFVDKVAPQGKSMDGTLSYQTLEANDRPGSHASTQATGSERQLECLPLSEQDGDLDPQTRRALEGVHTMKPITFGRVSPRVLRTTEARLQRKDEIDKTLKDAKDEHCRILKAQEARHKRELARHKDKYESDLAEHIATHEHTLTDRDAAHQRASAKKNAEYELEITRQHSVFQRDIDHLHDQYEQFRKAYWRHVVELSEVNQRMRIDLGIMHKSEKFAQAEDRHFRTMRWEQFVPQPIHFLASDTVSTCTVPFRLKDSRSSRADLVRMAVAQPCPANRDMDVKHYLDISAATLTDHTLTLTCLMVRILQWCFNTAFHIDNVQSTKVKEKHLWTMKAKREGLAGVRKDDLEATILLVGAPGFCETEIPRMAKQELPVLVSEFDGLPQDESDTSSDLERWLVKIMLLKVELLVSSVYHKIVFIPIGTTFDPEWMRATTETGGGPVINPKRRHRVTYCLSPALVYGVPEENWSNESTYDTPRNPCDALLENRKFFLGDNELWNGWPGAECAGRAWVVVEEIAEEAPATKAAADNTVQDHSSFSSSPVEVFVDASAELGVEDTTGEGMA